MTILEASTLGTIDKIYTKTMINYDTLKLNLKRCPYERVRNMLEPLLLGEISERKQFLDMRTSNSIVSSRKIKLLSSEKRRSSSKSQKKIELTTSRLKSKKKYYDH